MATTQQQQLASLEARGFDRTRISGRHVYPRCSQCEVLVIQGIACHEQGCPNETRECAECNARIAKRDRVCEDCASEGL